MLPPHRYQPPALLPLTLVFSTAWKFEAQNRKRLAAVRLYHLLCYVAEVMHALRPKFVLACVLQLVLTPNVIRRLAQQPVRRIHRLLFGTLLVEPFEVAKVRVIHIKH